MTLIVVADMVAKPGQEDALRAALTGLVAPTLAEPGCLQYDLHEDAARPGHFLFFERWETRELWDEGHNVSPHVEAFRARSGDLVASLDLFEMTRIAP